MKYAIPWVLVVVLAAGAYFFYSIGQQREAELARRQTSPDTNAETGPTRQGGQDPAALRAEVDRLKQENENLPRLRSEVGRLQAEVKQLNTDLQKSEAQLVQQRSQLTAENQTLRNESQQAQAQVQTQSQANACMANLRAIEAAKQQWAAQKGPPPNAIPTLMDIAPYLPNFALPVCPSGGVYTFNSLSLPPTCSIPGHSLSKRP